MQNDIPPHVKKKALGDLQQHWASGVTHCSVGVQQANERCICSQSHSVLFVQLKEIEEADEEEG